MLALLAACTGPTLGPTETAVAEGHSRTSVDTACALVSTCGFAELDPLRCVTDEALFDVTLFEGEVVAVSVVPGVAAGLSEGNWFTVFDSPTGSCDDAIVYGFEVSP